jgi:hypothetical protein
MATDKIGCAFTNDTTGFYSTIGYLPLLPAIQSTPGILIADTLNWVKISGNYVANGTEQFLLIGNFYDDANTYVDTVDNTVLYYSAYYYIDDVTITTITGINEQNQNILINVSPILFHEKLIISISNGELSEIIIYEIASKKLLQWKFTNSISLNTEQLAKGIYLYEVRNKNGVIKKGKVIRQ